MKFAEQVKEKETKILELEGQAEEREAKMKELEDKAQKYDEQLKLAEEEAEKERQNARKLEFTEVAKEIHGLPEMETDFADELMWLDESDDSEGKVHYNAVLNVLQALGNQEKAAKLFGEIGNDGETPASADSKVEKLVAEKMKDSDITVGEAYAEVFKDNPKLYAEYNEVKTEPKQE
jgi:hypothetical protein